MRFRTDKEEPHGYLPDYLQLAGTLGPDTDVCEVGVHQGGSLAMWQELFPGGMVIGVDNDPGCTWPDGTKRIVAGQDDPQLAVLVGNYSTQLGLVVDDASHIGHLTMATFAHLWPLVRPGGFYVVEDWADPWVSPGLQTWAQADPRYTGDELIDVVPGLIKALRNGADQVTYTREGLVIIRRGT